MKNVKILLLTSAISSTADENSNNQFYKVQLLLILKLHCPIFEDVIIKDSKIAIFNFRRCN